MKLKDGTLKILLWIALIWTILAGLAMFNSPMEDTWMYSLLYLGLLMWTQIHTLRKLE